MGNAGYIGVALLAFLLLRSRSTGATNAGGQSGGGRTGAGGNNAGGGGGGGGGTNYVKAAEEAARLGMSLWDYLQKLRGNGGGGDAGDGPGGYNDGEGGATFGEGDDGSEGQDPGEDPNQADPYGDEPVDPETPEGWVDVDFN